MPPVVGSDFRIVVQDKGQATTSPTLNHLVRHQAALPPPKIARRNEDVWSAYGFTEGRDYRLRAFVGFTPCHIRSWHLRKRLVQNALGAEQYIKRKRHDWEQTLPIAVYTDVWDSHDGDEITIAMIYRVPLTRGLVETDRRIGSPTLKALVELYHLVVDGLRLFVWDFSACRLQWGNVYRSEKYFHVPSDASDDKALGAILPPWIVATGDELSIETLKTALRNWVAVHRARIDLYRTDQHEVWSDEWDKAFAGFFASLIDDAATLSDSVGALWPIPTFRSALLKGVGPRA